MEANSKFTVKLLTLTYLIYAHICYISLAFNGMSSLYSITYMLFNTAEDWPFSQLLYQMQDETCTHAAEILTAWKNTSDQQMYAFTHLSKDVTQTEASNWETDLTWAWVL